ncbi:MAG: oligosaccharide flippase family protein [Flavobacteriaceae bacterium]|nr:oligosaccharide flippase family protein [Flavobacteriaceae bacterium]
MKVITDLLKGFINRSGFYIFSTTILSRILSFIASWIALQLLDHSELGVILLAFNIISFIIPIGGLGLHQSLIRYGAQLIDDKEKNDLFVYVLKRGIVVSIVLIVVLIIVSYFINFSFPNTQYYLVILSFSIIPFFLFEIVKIQFRLRFENRMYALLELSYNILFVAGVLVLTTVFKEDGYVLAIIVVPLITSLLFIKKLNINFKNNNKLSFTNLIFWKYGFFASLSNVVTQLLFVIDILLIGYLLNDPKMVTNYKYITLIPFSLLFLPNVFITTDFVEFTQRINDKKYIKRYIKGYLYFFVMISVIIISIFSILSKWLLLIFDEKLVQFNNIFLVLTLGVTGILIFRGLFGNLLSSIGKAHINYYIASIALILNILSNFYLIPHYGILGAAITSSVLMWLTGLFSLLFFYKFYYLEN